MRSSMSQIAVVFIFATAVNVSVAARADSEDASLSSYERFRLIHRQGQDGEDPVSFAEREALFEARKAEVAAHNAKKLSYTTEINKFSDFTEAELQSMMGYKRSGGRWARAQSSFLQLDGAGSDDEHDVGSIDVAQLAETVDWRSNLNFSNFVHNQGACGSCWAHAAVAALEAHAEIAGHPVELATDQMIKCSVNPRKCGGDGACHGSTSEIGLEYVGKYGIASKADFREGCPADQKSALNIDGFVRLPSNKASHLMHALSTKGPVVMSIAANSLHSYKEGVFSGCKPDTVVNHAVLGVGYGMDSASGKGYWNIKNSWGDTWGEKGYFRVERKADDSWYCGTDNAPEKGVYCAEHPASIPVCSMCGITSDSVYPRISSGSVSPKVNKIVPATHLKNLRAVQSKVDPFSVM